MKKERLSGFLSGECRISVMVFPFVISLILSSCIIRAVTGTELLYGSRMMAASLAVSLVWMALFLTDSRRIAKGKTKKTLACSPLAALILSVSFGFYLAYTVWGSKCLTLAPLEQLDNGTQHLDTLFLSSLSESFRRFPAASTLLNSEAYIPYHTFSPLLMSAVAGILRVPAFIAYNYMYPVLFIPVYVAAQILAVAAAKEYFSGRAAVKITDLAVILLVNTGFVLQSWLDAYGIWKRNLVISESFLTANTLAFACYGIIFHVLKHPGEGIRRTNLLLFLGIPAGIFLITWSKISVGLLFAVSVAYYLFRTHRKEFRYWGINILYGAVLLLALWLFSLKGAVSPPSGQNAWTLGAFREYCTGRLGIWGHWLVLMILPGLFILAEIFRLRKEKQVFATGKTVWIEDLLLMAVVAFLPGFLIVIDGGSASYFSCALEVPAILLLCGHPLSDPGAWFRGKEKLRGNGLKKAVSILCVIWCVAMCWVNKPDDPMNYVTGQHESTLSEMLTEIRDAYGGHPEDYTIYLDRDNLASRTFKPWLRVEVKTMYAWPAMTGIGVINATYRDGEAVYAYTGTQVPTYGKMSNYGVEYTDSSRVMTLEEALEKAGERGKKGLIHVTADGYEILETGK